MIPSNLAIGNSAPLAAFEKRWADLKFKTQAKAFLAKFVDGGGQPIEHPSFLCRRQGLIDGTRPSSQEIEALEAAIAFAFLDTNPRRTSSNRQQHVITADNDVGGNELLAAFVLVDQPDTGVKESIHLVAEPCLGLPAAVVNAEGPHELRKRVS